MKKSIDIAPERINEEGLDVRPEDTYFAFDPNEGEMHALGNGFEDGENLLREAEHAVSADDFHVVAHVARSVGEAGAEDVVDLADRLNQPSEKLVRLAKHPLLCGVDVPEITDADLKTLSDRALVATLLDEQVRSELRANPNPESVIQTAQLIEEFENRGINVDDYDRWEELLRDVAGG